MSTLINNHPLTKLNVLSFKGVQMRTFHITWLMFFVCFFGWFGLAPLMPTIRADLGLTKSQIGNTIISAVSATIIARLLIGRIMRYMGAKKNTYRLLILGILYLFFWWDSHRVIPVSCYFVLPLVLSVLRLLLPSSILR